MVRLLLLGAFVPVVLFVLSVNSLNREGLHGVLRPRYYLGGDDEWLAGLQRDASTQAEEIDGSALSRASDASLLEETDRGFEKLLGRKKPSSNSEENKEAQPAEGKKKKKSRIGAFFSKLKQKLGFGKKKGPSQADNKAPSQPTEESPEEAKPVPASVVQSIVTAVKSSISAKAHKKKSKSTQQLVELAYEAMVEMSGGTDKEHIILSDVKDAVTGKTVLEKCVIKELRNLGVGGTGIVEAVGVVDEKDAAVLGTKELALKLMFYDFKQLVPPSSKIEDAAQMVKGFLSQELEPLRAMVKTLGKAAEGTAKSISHNNHWALPLYQASLGSGKKFVVHKTVGFLRDVVLSEIMVGDGLDLLEGNQKSSQPARQFVQAQEHVCAQLIQATAKLHDAGICHSDIKLENILIGGDGSVYLADFGMSGKLNKKRRCGHGVTTRYMDPQHAKCSVSNGSENFDPKYDAWSVGLTCFVLLTRSSFPYDLNYYRGSELESYLAKMPEEVEKKNPTLKDPESDLKKAKVSQRWADIIGRLLKPKREDRTTVQELVKESPSLPVDGN